MDFRVFCIICPILQERRPYILRGNLFYFHLLTQISQQCPPTVQLPKSKWENRGADKILLMSTSEAVTTHSILIFCITNTVACILPSHAFCSLKEIFNNTIYAVDFSKLILSTDSLNLWLVNQCVWERMISLSKSCMPLVLLCKEQALNQTGWLFCLCLVSTGGYFRVIFHHVALWDSMFYIAYQCEKARTGTLF